MPIWFTLTVAAVLAGLGFLFQLFAIGRQIASYAGMMFAAAQACSLLGYGMETLVRKTGVVGRGEVSVAGVAVGALLGLVVGAFLAPYAVRYLWVYWLMIVVATLFVLSWFAVGL